MLHVSAYDVELSSPEDMTTIEGDLEALERRLETLPSTAPPSTRIADFQAAGYHPESYELEFLRAENYALKQRAWILEMVSSHAPLPRTLSAIATLARNRHDATGAALWVANGNLLSFEADANLPDDLDEVVSSLSLDVDDISAQPCDWFEDRIREAAARRGDQAEFVPLRGDEGKIVGLLVVFGHHHRKGGTPAGTLMHLAHLASLAIESDKVHERLAFHAQHDALTGLPNRLLFLDRVKQAIAVAERENEKAAVLWLDLDHFKQTNDTLGHTAGDELLCEIARRLRASVHPSDTVARFGGDEFTIVISNATSEDVVEIVCARILQAICRPVTLNGHEIRISASIGMSMYPDNGLNADLLMRNADLGMYHAKRSGRNQYQMFSPEFGNSLERRLEIEKQLENALETDEFHLEYQPLVGLDGEIAGMEALLRWDNARLGRVAPSEFIPVPRKGA